MATIYDLSASNPSVPSAGADRPYCPIWLSVTVTDTHTGVDDNAVLCALMPPVAYIPNRVGAFRARWEDLDTNATETLDLSLGFSDADGALDSTFLALTTAAEDAGQAESAVLATSDPFIDIGGKYVNIYVVTKAATGATGVVQIAFDYTQNVNNQSVA